LTATYLPEVSLACWLEVTVQHGGIKVDPIWPHDRSAFGIHSYLRKETRIVEGLEHCSLVPTCQEFELTHDPIVEREPHDMVSRHLDRLDVGNPVPGLHGSGSIVPGGWLAFAFSQAASSSIW
jgi:hypothetical protein